MWSYCFVDGSTIITKEDFILLMATRNPVNSPVEVGCLYPVILQGFSTIPGGWEWDF